MSQTSELVSCSGQASELVRARARAIMLDGSSIEIVRLGSSSTVSGMSHRNRVFAAGVVRCSTSTLQGSSHVFFSEEKERKKKQKKHREHRNWKFL